MTNTTAVNLFSNTATAVAGLAVGWFIFAPLSILAMWIGVMMLASVILFVPGVILIVFGFCFFLGSLIYPFMGFYAYMKNKKKVVAK